MPTMTVAQLVAMISADTSALETRLTKAEERITSTQAVAEKAAAAIETSFTRSAKGVETVEQAAKNAQKGLANLAKFEYEQGNLSQQAYQVFLQRRMAAYSEYTAEWKSAATQLVAIDRSINAEMLTADRQFQSEKLALIKSNQKAIQESERVNQSIISSIQKEAEIQRIADAKAANAASASRRQNISKGIGAGFGLAGGAAAGITAVELGSAIMSSDFQQKTTAIANNTLMTDVQLKDMQKTTLDLGKQTGVAFDDIANGYMRVSNHGYEAAQAAKVLKVATLEAMSTQASADDVANALAGTMHVYHVNVDEVKNGMDGATRTMNLLDRAASRANSTMEEWTLGTGTATAAGAAFNVKLADVEAALTSLTQNKFSVSEADTQVKNMIYETATPLKAVRETLATIEPAAKKMGIDIQKDFSPAGLQAKGLYGVLQDVLKVTHGNADAVGRLYSARRGGLGVMVLLNKAEEDYKKHLEENTRMQEGIGGNPVGSNSARMLQTPTQQWAKFQRTIEADFIPVGDKAAKILERLEPDIMKLADAVLWVMNAFQRLPKSVQTAVTMLGALKIIGSLTTMMTGFRLPTELVGVGIGKIIKLLGKGAGGLVEATAEAGGGLAGFGTALTELAVAGGPVALVVGALVGLGIEVYKIKQAYDDMKGAQDQAAKSTAQFAAMQASVSSQGERGALIVNRQQIAQTLSGRKQALNSYLSESQTPGDYDPGLLAKIAQARKDIAKLSSDYAKEGKRLDTLNSSGTGFNAVSIGTAGTIGSKAALAADMEQANSAASDCQHRAKVIIQSATHAFDGLFKGSAKTTAEAMVKAGVMQDYTPGMTLKPGDLLYSTTMSKSGHVQAIDSHGNRRDQYGKNHFNPRNFQYLFDPDYAASKLGSSDNGSSLSGTPGGLTGPGIDALAAAQKSKIAADKEAAREAKAAAKALETNYESEKRGLQQIIVLKGQETELDRKHDNLNKTRFDVSSQGQLAGLAKSKANELLNLANLADQAEQVHKINSLMQKMSDTETVKGLSPNLQKAVGEAGGYREWLSLGQLGKKNADGFTQAQQQMVDAVNRFNIADAVRKSKESIQDMILILRYAGNEAVQAAIQAEGGAKAWNALGNQMGPKHAGGFSDAQQTLIDSERTKQHYTDKQSLTDQLGSIKTQHSEFLQGFNETYNPNSANAGQTALDKWEQQNKKMIKRIEQEHNASQSAMLKSTEDRIKAEAQFEEKMGSTKVVLDSSKETVNKTAQLGHSLADYYDPVMKAVHDWEDANATALQRIRADWGSVGDAAIKAYENQLKAYTIAQTQTDLNLQTNQLNDKTTADFLGQRAYSNPGDKAVADWIAQNPILIKELGATSKAVLDYETALKKNVDTEDKLAKAQQRRQDIVQGLTDGIMGGITSAFSPDANNRSTLQTQLYEQQSQLLQYQVAEQQFNNQYPNDPNDPYLQRLKQIQDQIDNTNKKLHDMGNNLVSVFTRFFDSIYNTFKQTLVKMAQEYLQSQLLSYLTRQIGTGAGFTQPGQSQSGWGAVVGVLGTVLGGIGGGKAGTPATATPVPVGPTFYAAAGGRVVPGAPTWVNDDELFIPDSPGNVVPKSKIKPMPTGESPINQNVHMIINTPDVRSFMHSRATIGQKVARAVRPRR